MRALCSDIGADGRPQLIFYSIGVNGFLGGLFGKGIDENIRLAYEWLVQNYNEGDEIFIFGFSRGAYTARALAGLVAIEGILTRGAPIGTGELYERYKLQQFSLWKLKETGSANTTSLSLQDQWILKYSRPTQIKFVGVWDTVGSIGWSKGNIPKISRSKFDYLHTGLRIHILNAYHALAIDEKRADFSPTLWDKRIPISPLEKIAVPRSVSSVEQRWFAGAHANVGGGYATDLLPQRPLQWMMKKAEMQGLTFRSHIEIDGDYFGARIADSYGDFGGGMYRFLSFPATRTIGIDPFNTPDGHRVSVNETIDATVFERWRRDPNYRPGNLTEWAARRGVDPATIHATVRTDNPSITVSD